MKDSFDRECAALTANGGKKPGGKNGNPANLRRGVTVRQHGQVSPATRYARDLFLNGNGDGKPVTNTLELSRRSGASVGTIEKWRPVWERERAAQLRGVNSGKASLVEKVTAEDLAWHDSFVKELKIKCDALKKVLSTLTPGSKSYQENLKTLSATLKMWREMSGVAAVADCQATLLKEQLKIRARLEGKPAPAPVERQVTAFSFNTASTDKE